MPQEDEYISTFKINNPEVNKGMDKILKKQQFHHFIKLLEAKQKELSQLCEEKRIDENLTRILREQIVELLEKLSNFTTDIEEYTKSVFFPEIIIRKAYPQSIFSNSVQTPMKHPKDEIYYANYGLKK